jgi:L-rhamnose mutarotase
MKQYCLALDLKDDAALIAAYEEWHKNIWPEVVQSIKNAGIEKMEIFRTGNRLFMIVLATDNFSFESKAAMDAANEKVQKWEQLMWNFQQPLPGSKPGEKWILMDKIFTV